MPSIKTSFDYSRIHIGPIRWYTIQIIESFFEVTFENKEKEEPTIIEDHMVYYANIHWTYNVNSHVSL
jgi:CRISPR/Cas system type I-B associated protein Csh2 (Cas7 group RAMP superfamily)